MPFDPAPTLLWTMHRHDAKVASCELGFTPLGAEIRILRDTSLLYSRILPTGEEALAWAEEERRRLIAQGCVPWIRLDRIEDRAVVTGGWAITPQREAGGGEEAVHWRGYVTCVRRFAR